MAEILCILIPDLGATIFPKQNLLQNKTKLRIVQPYCFELYFELFLIGPQYYTLFWQILQTKIHMESRQKNKRITCTVVRFVCLCLTKSVFTFFFRPDQADYSNFMNTQGGMYNKKCNFSFYPDLTQSSAALLMCIQIPSTTVNSSPSRFRFFVPVNRGTKLRVYFNIESQWSVSR